MTREDMAAFEQWWLLILAGSEVLADTRPKSKPFAGGTDRFTTS